MDLLPFIKDEDLKTIVIDVLKQARLASHKSDSKFNRNVIDPFAALFEMAGFGLDSERWLQNEKIRQAQKSLQNQIGAFHQRVLGKIPGWEDKGTGAVIDLVSDSRKIVAEIKNKYNTVSGGKRVDVYDDLENLIMPKGQMYKGYTAYLVEVIPKTPIRYDIEFTPSDKTTGGKRSPNPKLRQIDGASFYALATGDENALKKLFDVLPSVVEECGCGYAFTDKTFLGDFFKSAYGR